MTGDAIGFIKTSATKQKTFVLDSPPGGLREEGDDENKVGVAALTVTPSEVGNAGNGYPTLCE